MTNPDTVSPYENTVRTVVKTHCLQKPGTGELIKLEAERILLPPSHSHDALENGNPYGEGLDLLFSTHRDLVKLGTLLWENFPPVFS